jgi:hypothetical protein
MLEIIAGVHDNGEAFTESLREPVRELRAPDATG